MKNHRIIITLVICTIVMGLGGCDEFFRTYPTVNSCIKDTNQDLEDITTLVCDPGYDHAFDSSDYDLLGKLTNLESITIIGIGSEETAQLYFEELAKLEKLSSIEINDSTIGSISKLAEVKSLTSLSIILRGGSWFKIDDIDLLGEKGSFLNLKTLKLKNGELESIPDIHKLSKLESLALSGFDFSTLHYERVDWNKLIYLDISYTSIKAIDDRIVDDLYNLEALNLSHSKITDIQFVLRLPSLIDFSYFYTEDIIEVDLEPLREHPNFKESWLNNGY